MTSFDEMLTCLHNERGLFTRDDVWSEGTKEFNQKISIAQNLLNVEWVDNVETGGINDLLSAQQKVDCIMDLRTSIEAMSKHMDTISFSDSSFMTDNNELSRDMMEKFVKADKEFSFTNKSAAFNLLLDCLSPTNRKRE